MISRNGEFKKEKMAWTLRMLICCLMVVGLVGLVSVTGYAATCTYSGDGDWDTDANWLPGGTEPGVDDLAIIPNGSDVTIAAAEVCDELDIADGGSLTITGGSLTIDGDQAVDDDTNTIAGDLTLSAAVTADFGSADAFTLASTGTITISTAAGTITLGGINTIGGTVTVAVGTLDLDGNTTISVSQTVSMASGEIDLDAAATLGIDGTLSVTGGTLDLNGAATIGAAGSLTGTAGAVEIGANFTNSAGGDVTLSGTSTTEIDTGAVDITGGSGTTRFQTLTATTAPTFKGAGNIDLYGVFTANAAVVVNGAVTTVTVKTGGSADFNNTFTITDGSFVLEDGVPVGFAGTVTNSDALATAFNASSSSVITFSATLNIISTTDGFSFGGPVIVQGAGIIVSITDGDVTFNENVLIGGGDELAANFADGDCVITVAAGKTIELETASSVLDLDGKPAASGKRIVIKSGTPGTPFYLDASASDGGDVQLTHVAIRDCTLTDNAATDAVTVTATDPYCISAGGNNNAWDTYTQPDSNLLELTPKLAIAKADETYTIGWTALAADDTISYNIYVSDDDTLTASDVTDGNLITSSVGAGSYSWDTTLTSPGPYYVYLQPADDTDYVAVSNYYMRVTRAYFDDSISNEPLDDDDVATSDFEITWNDNNGTNGPAVKIRLYYSATGTYTDVGVIQNLDEVNLTASSQTALSEADAFNEDGSIKETDTTDSVVWDVAGITPGTYYVYIVSTTGNASYDVSGSVEIIETSIQINTLSSSVEDGGTGWYTIEWRDEDDLNNAEILLYYSTVDTLADPGGSASMAGKALTSTQITEFESNISTADPGEEDPTTDAVLINSSTIYENDDGDDDRYLWDLSSIVAGNYYIYAILDSNGDGSGDSGYQSSSTVQVQHQDAFVWYYDASETPLYNNRTTEAISTGTTFSIAQMTTSDFLYIGGYEPFDTITIDVDDANVNAIASVMTGYYSNDGSTWTDLTVTDTTENPGGITLGQDGDVTWTLPTTWNQCSVNDGITRYWVRIGVSVTLSLLTAIDDITLDAEDSSVTVTSPANDIIVSDSCVIRWVDRWNGKTTADVQLYYSATGTYTTASAVQTNATAIVFDRDPAGPTGSSYTWNIPTDITTDVAYYIYAVLDEEGIPGGATGEVTDRAPGTVTVTSEYAVTLTNSTEEPTVGETYTVTIKVDAGGDAIKSAAIYLDFNTTYLNVASVTGTFTYLLTTAIVGATDAWSVTEFMNSGDNTAGTASYVIGSPTANTLTVDSANNVSLASIDFVVQQTGNLSVEISTAPGRTTSFVDTNGNKHYPTVAKPVSGVALGTISGTIDLEGRANESAQITFELRRPGSLGNTSLWETALEANDSDLDEDDTLEGVQVTIDSDGGFYLTDVPTGYWYLTAKAPNYLRRQNVDTVANGNTAVLAITPGANTTVYFQQLKGGECYDATELEDNDIDANDMSVLATYFGGTEEGADIDGNGAVDVDDFTMLASNFGNHTAAYGIAGPYGSAYTGVANAAPSVEVSEAMLELVGIPEQPKMGKWFKVQVVLKNVENIRGYAFNLEYDPTQMQVVAKEGDFLAKNSSSGMPLFINKTIDTEDGKKLALAEALMGSDIAGASGEGTVVTLTIKPLKAGPLAITLIDGRIMPISGKSKVITEIMHPVIEVIKTPAASVLRQNYPNPFNPETWIPYSLKNDAKVEIRIYNAAGQLVYKLHQGFREADHYVTKDKAAYWNGRNEYGERAASGIYFYQIRAGNFAATRKMVILK